MNGKTLPMEILNERRRLAVKLRLSGMTVAEVARHVELSAPTVIAAHQAYLSGSWEAVSLRARGRRPGEGRLLDAGDEANLLMTMGTHTPEEAGLAGKAWSATWSAGACAPNGRRRRSPECTGSASTACNLAPMATPHRRTASAS